MPWALPQQCCMFPQDHLEYMRVRLVEFGTNRTVIDQTWARADYPVNTDIYRNWDTHSSPVLAR